MQTNHIRPLEISVSGLYHGSPAEYGAHCARARADRRASIYEPYSVNAPPYSVNVPPYSLNARPDSVKPPAAAAYGSANDLSLVADMARAEERAAAALYDRHGAVMYGLALRMVGEAADAEEVVLDAFAQAWREADRYDTSRGSVLGWLTTIVRTRALDTIRARGRRSKMVDAASARLDEPAAMGEPLPSPDRAAEESERAGAVSSALKSLPEQQRRAIELAFFEGLTHQEVAERLREPLGTVKTRIRLGMLKLRDMLGGLAPEPA